MQERFKQLLEEKNLTATRFAAMIKVNASAMSHILNGRSKPGFDVLDKIAQAFPDVNLNWLISGKGSLYNTGIPSATFVEKTPLFEVPNQERGQVVLSDEKKSDENTSLQPPGSFASNRRKIKRIVLFFEDGSFEDYEK